MFSVRIPFFVLITRSLESPLPARCYPKDIDRKWVLVLFPASANVPGQLCPAVAPSGQITNSESSRMKNQFSESSGSGSMGLLYLIFDGYI